MDHLYFKKDPTGSICNSVTPTWQTGLLTAGRSKAFPTRPVYFLRNVKRRPDIAIDLYHGKREAYVVTCSLGT